MSQEGNESSVVSEDPINSVIVSANPTEGNPDNNVDSSEMSNLAPRTDTATPANQNEDLADDEDKHKDKKTKLSNELTSEGTTNINDNSVKATTGDAANDNSATPNTSNPNSTANANNNKKQKVPLHLLEKRRIGRIKAAEEFAKRLKKIGIERNDVTTLPTSGGFKPLQVINQKNYSSDYIRKDDQIFALRERRLLRNTNSNTNTNTNTNTNANANNNTNTTTSNSVQQTPLPTDLNNTDTNNNNINKDDSVKNDSVEINIDNKDMDSFNDTNTNIINNTNNNNQTTSEFTLENEDVDYTDSTTTIILQPGSESIKIGFALDEKPIIVPNCIAVPKKNYDNNNDGTINNNEIEEKEQNKLTKNQPEEFILLKEDLQKVFKERMMYYKRRIQPDSYDLVKKFNNMNKIETYSDKNDPARLNWIHNSNNANEPQNKNFIGDEAILCSEENFIHRKPFCIRDGKSLFNLSDPNYNSIHETLGDISLLLNYSINKLLDQKKRQLDEKNKIEPTDISTDSNIDDKQSSQDGKIIKENDNQSIKNLNNTVNHDKTYKIILIIPDLFEKSHVEVLINLLLTELPFNAVALMQESLASCYGSGISASTCVVNIGATTTKVACVDDGTVLPNSIVSLNYGGNDITKLFTILLLMNDIPFKDWNLNNIPDWIIAENLKKKCITFQDADVTTQLFSLIKRIPGKQSEKIEFMAFDEVMLAPLALFYPQIFKFLKKDDENILTNETISKQLPPSRDLFTNKLNDWNSLTDDNCVNNQLYCDLKNENDIIKKIITFNSRENSTTYNENGFVDKLNMAPLDKAIIQSITNASINLDNSKISSFYGNILLVGGTSNIPGFDFMLTDRLNIWRPRSLSVNSFPDFYMQLIENIKKIEEKFKKSENSTKTNVVTTNNSTPVPGENNDNDTTVMTTSNVDSNKNDKLNEQIEELINSSIDKYLKTIEQQSSNDSFMPVSVFPIARDIDPSLVIWRGGCVFAQIRLIEELFITESDWDVHGSRILQQKCIFAY